MNSADLPSLTKHQLKLVSSSTLNDAETRQALSLLASGVSRYKVAQRMGVQWQVIYRLADKAEQNGVLQPLKDRMRAKLGILLERDLDERLVHEEKMQPVEFGVLFDKHALLSGDPTEIVEVQDQGADRLAQAMEGLRGGRSVVEVLAEVVEKPVAQLTEGAPEAKAEARPKFRRTIEGTS